MQPFQIIFNPTSASELARMPKDLQLQVLGQFRGLPHELQRENPHFGSLSKGGRSLVRYRLGNTASTSSGIPSGSSSTAS